MNTLAGFLLRTWNSGFPKKSGKQIAKKKEEKNAKKVLFACFFLARFFPGVKQPNISIPDLPHRLIPEVY